MNKNIGIIIGIVALVLVGIVLVKGGSYRTTQQDTVATLESGSPWIWTETVYSSSDTIKPQGTKPFTVSFATSGRVHVSGDCNTMSGTYTTEGNTITLAPMVSTKMYCEGSQENLFAGDFAQIESYEIVDNMLTFTLAYNAGTMVFMRGEVEEQIEK